MSPSSSRPRPPRHPRHRARLSRPRRGRRPQSVTASRRTAAFVTLGPRLPDSDREGDRVVCAEGTSNPGGRADERLFIANIDPRVAPASRSCRARPGREGQADLASRRAHVDSARRHPGDRRARSPRRGDGWARDRDPLGRRHQRLGVTVPMRVTQRRSGTSPPARRSRARSCSSRCSNPFADDAIVDIDFLTNFGPLAPDDLQGFVVPAHSRVTVPIQDQARRTDLVADRGAAPDGAGSSPSSPRRWTGATGARAWRCRSAAPSDSAEN